MRNSIRLSLPAAAALVVGCAGMPGERGPCTAEETGSTHTLTLNARATDRRTRLQIAPPRVSVCPGDTVRIRIVPPVQAGQASTEPKPGTSADWLDVDTGDGETIEIPVVPTDDDEYEGRVPRGNYDYFIEVDDIGMLDPRIIVR